MDPLPGWVTDNRTAVAREGAPYRGLSAEARSRATAAACRAAARQLASRPDRERILESRDPLPESWASAWEKLRERSIRTGKVGIALLLALAPAYVAADCDARPRAVASLRVHSCEPSMELATRKVAGLGYPEEALATLAESAKRVVVVTGEYVGSSAFPSEPTSGGEQVDAPPIDPQDRRAKQFVLVDSTLAWCRAHYANRELRVAIEDPAFRCCRDVNPPAYETAAECVLRFPAVLRLIAP